MRYGTDPRKDPPTAIVDVKPWVEHHLSNALGVLVSREYATEDEVNHSVKKLAALLDELRKIKGE